MIIVRTNSSEGDSAPRLTLWEDITSVESAYRRIDDDVDPPTDQVILGQNLDRIVYTFDPPVAVMENQFVGFLVSFTSKLHSHRIAFEDAGEGRVPVSIHTSTMEGFLIQVDNIFTREISQFIPLITAIFGKPFYTLTITLSFSLQLRRPPHPPRLFPWQPPSLPLVPQTPYRS